MTCHISNSGCQGFCVHCCTAPVGYDPTSLAGSLIACCTAETLLLGIAALTIVALFGSRKKNSWTRLLSSAMDHGAPVTPDKFGLGIDRPLVLAEIVCPPNLNPVTS